MDVLIHQDHLELWYGNECLEHLPRLFGQGKERIDFRHVIDSLVRKPGAFANYKYVNHLYPTTRFRMAFDQLLAGTSEKAAVKQYLQDECAVQFITVAESTDRAFLEHFVIAILRPEQND